MFEINRTENRISKLEERTFSELNIREREHLQEWLANTPSALGEELLIIQKEFSGFIDTNERLDLLALDKEGRLVIIENKLDDSGRDVVWQALKYVSYCASLKKSDITKIFQDYLRQQNRDEEASALICEFLEAPTIDEVILNSGSNQRVILVAANFRKEVTSTALWLISNGINVKCMKVTPYEFDEKLMLDIAQIIPTPEAEDYMISMSSKANEEKKEKTAMQREREQRNPKFWRQMLDHFQTCNFNLYENINPGYSSFLNKGSGISGCSYTVNFGKSKASVEFYIQSSTREKSKRLFDFLHGKKQEIEKVFESNFRWHRRDDKKSCSIQYLEPFDGYNEENWPEINEWLLENMKKLHAAISPLIPEIKAQLKDTSPGDSVEQT